MFSARTVPYLISKAFMSLISLCYLWLATAFLSLFFKASQSANSASTSGFLGSCYREGSVYVCTVWQHCCFSEFWIIASCNLLWSLQLLDYLGSTLKAAPETLGDPQRETPEEITERYHRVMASCFSSISALLEVYRTGELHECFCIEVVSHTILSCKLPSFCICTSCKNK